MRQEDANARWAICLGCHHRREVVCERAAGVVLSQAIHDPARWCPQGKWPASGPPPDFSAVSPLDDCFGGKSPIPNPTPKAAILRRNLIYHCCPLRANDGWQKNLDQLRRRWHVFNGGRKLIAVSLGEGLTASLGDVAGQLPADAELIAVPNDPILRETASLPILLDVIHNNTRLDEATFFAHTKGTSTLATNYGTMSDSDRILGATRWRNAMYHHLLDRADECMERLKLFACVGTTQMICSPQRRFRYPSGLPLKTWMFAGTFFWFRNDAVFSHPGWRRVPKDRYGAEAWLGGLFPSGRSYSVFQPWDLHTFPAGSPYDPSYYSAEFDES